MRNVDVAVLLTAPGLEYGPVTLFEYFRVGQWAEAAAGGVIYPGDFDSCCFHCQVSNW